MILLLVVTSLIFLGYYLVFTRIFIFDNCLRLSTGGMPGFNYPHQKIILAGLFTFGQIILTQLFLGITGGFYLDILVYLNLGLMIIVLLFSGVFAKNTPINLKLELQRISGGIRNAVTPLNIILVALIGFLILWVLIDMYLLPQRQADELTYHLPVIFQYIINHKVYLLPVEINKRFAFPENAEFLFMWPAIFLHSQIFVSFFQILASLWGTVVIYGLARLLGISSKISLFVSLLFLFTPVVLYQLTCSYTDNIIAVFILTLLYCAGMYFKSGRLIYFYASALAAGLLFGMKYNEFIFIPMIIPFLCMKNQVKSKNWVYFILIILISGGYWYFRNLFQLGTPIYPTPFSKESLGIYSARHENVSLMGFLMLIPEKLTCLWQDPGTGTLHGGYGLIFWGLAFPAWLYVWAQSFFQKKRFDLMIYSSFLIGVGQLWFITLIDYLWVGRYSIFIVGIGLLALGQIIMIFDRFSFFIKCIKSLCLLFSLLSIILLCGNSGYFNIVKPVNDFVNKKYLTQQDYCQWAFQAWGLLDYLTLNDAHGLSCIIDSLDSLKMFVLSSAYGTKLQNRVWELQQDKTRLPDAFIYVSNNPRLTLKKREPNLILKEKMDNHDYLFIIHSPGLYLFIRKDFFKDVEKQKLLNNYFKVTRGFIPVTWPVMYDK